MKRTRFLLAVAAFFLAVACSKGPWATRADSSIEPGNARLSKAVAKSQPNITIPPGTKLRVALLDGVSSDKSRPGDFFLASLTEPVVINGHTVLAKGTMVRGQVVDAKESRRVKGRASLELRLTEIVRDDGRSIDISTKPYTAVADTTRSGDPCAPPAATRKEVRFEPEYPLSFALAGPIEV